MTRPASDGTEKNMSKRFVVALLLSALFASSALANPSAPEVYRDPRIRYLAYAENNVYRLDVFLKSVSAVQFSDEEQIESILIGDSVSWEVVKLKNGHVISLKAKIPSMSTNMTVYTDKRVYTFELHSMGDTPASGGSLSPLRTVFKYAAPKRAKVASRPPKVEQINSGYMVAGQTEFRPTWVQDNGHQTSFFIAEGAPRPAIFKVGPKKEEQLVNSRTQGNRIVVDGISDYWVLRIGDEAICIRKGNSVRGNPNVGVEKVAVAEHAG